MRMATIVYSSDNVHWTRMALRHLQATTDESEIILVDNGSTPPYSEVDDGVFLPLADRIIRYDENIGGNAVFHRWLTEDWWDERPEFIAFLHCDLMIHEEGWDRRVMAGFDVDPLLDLVGFVGSNEIDRLGGRGSGTMLNFRGGHFVNYGDASKAEVHGRRMTGFAAAAVVDHCAMVFRASALAKLTPQEGHYAPEHFYDRILSCEVIERGGHINVVGIDCDHFSGGIGDGMKKADALRRRWLDTEGIAYDPADTYGAVYRESERRFFERFGGFFPFRVDSQHRVLR